MASEALTPEAEALSQALGKSLYGYPNAPATEQDIARVVVEQLGITKAHHVAVTHEYMNPKFDGLAPAIAALLELAGAGE